MILSTKANTRISNNTLLKYYQNKGYDFETAGINITVKVEDLSPNSHSRIDVQCDCCGNKKNIQYRHYLKNIKKYNLYSCSEQCAHNLRKNKNTLFEKYGDENYVNIEKAKNTNLKKYGYVSNFSDKNEREKHSIIKEKKYGDKNFNNKEKTKITVNNKSFEEKDEIIKRTSKTKKDRPQYLRDLQISRLEETNLKRYGVKSAMHNDKIHQKSLKNAFRNRIHIGTGLKYQGLNEKDFLDFCINNKIQVEKGKSIKYFFDNKERCYYSDFLLPKYNLIIEIKSLYTLRYDLKKNFSKRRNTIKNGYNFLFIIDFDYTKIKSIINLQ